MRNMLTLSPSVVDFNDLVDNRIIVETGTLGSLDLFGVTTYSHVWSHGCHKAYLGISILEDSLVSEWYLPASTLRRLMSIGILYTQ
jgi:hypothetical protein